MELPFERHVFLLLVSVALLLYQTAGRDFECTQTASSLQLLASITVTSVYFRTVDRSSRYDEPISQTLKSVFNKLQPEKEDHCECVIASVWSILLLLDMRDYFNMRANLSSGPLSLSSPVVLRVKVVQCSSL